MSRRPRATMQTTEAFERMFADEAGAREADLGLYDPTDVQAEIMVYDAIGPEYVQGVLFETPEDLALHRHVVAGFKAYAVGRGQALFGTRQKRLKSLV